MRRKRRCVQPRSRSLASQAQRETEREKEHQPPCEGHCLADTHIVWDVQEGFVVTQQENT